MSFDFETFSHLLSQMHRLNMTLRIEGDELVIRPGGRLTPRALAFFRENKPAIIAVLRLRHHFEQSAQDTEKVNRLHLEAQRLCGCKLLKSGYPMRVGRRHEVRFSALHDTPAGQAEREEMARRLEAAQLPLEEIEERQAA